MICSNCNKEFDGTPDKCSSVCPFCGQQHSNTEVWTRVVGFYRPTKQFNDGKREEYKDRKEYKLK